MSDHFSGFSQEEIKKVSYPKTKKSEITRDTFHGQHVGIRRAVVTTPQRRQETTTTTKFNNKKSNMNLVVNGVGNATKPTKKTTTNENNNDSFDEVNLDRSMSKSIEEALFYQPMKLTMSTNRQSAENTANIENIKPIADESSLLKLPTDKSETEISTSSDANSIDSSILQLKSTEHSDVKAIDLSTDSPFKGISLKDFESHRKLIEEQNRQKKCLLQKAIEHHSQKTAAEARKIEDIRCELAKLDNDLAVDVAILRKQIDNACINFTNIEKNYIKIEAQFLKAKIDLHNAAEKKELLTEHLCTVIAHNEDRKAQKLSELMQKVGLTPTGEYDETHTNGSDK